MICNFNSEQVATIRIPVSLKFDVDDMYENLILPARNSRTLTTLIQDLLRLYYENDHVRALIENDTENALELDALLQQVDGILAAEKENTAYMSMLQTQVDGMNDYLEQQHSVLSSELESGINGFADFTDFAEYENTQSDNVTNEPVLQLSVQDTVGNAQDTQVNSTLVGANSSDTDVVSMVQVLMQQMNTLCQKVSAMEHKTDSVGIVTAIKNESVNKVNFESGASAEIIEDIDDEDADEKAAETIVEQNNAKTHTSTMSLRTPNKKNTGVSSNMMKLMGSMEKM